MKKLLLFLVVVLISLGNIVNAQSTYVVANGTATNTYLPVYGTWMDANQHDQFIYPMTEVGPLSGATISKITFHSSVATTNSAWGTATCVISLGVTTQSNYASASYDLSTLTQVYSGPISVVNGIMEFTLTTPYLFPGGNLLVDITTVTSGAYSSVTFSGISATNGGMYQYGTNAPVLQQFLPKMTALYTGGTPTVVTSPASPVFATSATLNGAFFNLTAVTNGFQYMPATSTDWTSATTINATATTSPMAEVISGLLPTTEYKFRAFANDGTASYYGNELTFTTLSLPATLPYACDFENPTENTQWTFINGTQTNKFYIGDATQNPAINNTLGGSNALYISADTGATWGYLGTGTATNSWVYAYRDFEVPTGVSELKLDFDWIANGGVATSEFLRVYWMPVNIPVTAGNLPPTIGSVNYDLAAMIGNYTGGYGSHWLSRQTTWQHAQFTINTTQFPTLAGTTWRLYVHWRNNQTTAVQPPATFDNMTLVVSNCPTPRIDSITNVTASSVDVYFTEMGSASTWNVQYKPLTSSTWTTVQATTNPTTIPGLNGSTSYEFRIQADCGSEQSAWSPKISKSTACGTISQFPWGEGFEIPTTWPAAVAPGNSTAPPCWLNLNGGASATSVWRRATSASYIRTGTGSAQEYSGGSTAINNDWLVTPPLTLTGNERIRFWAKGYSTYTERFSVYIYDITTNLQDVTLITDTTLFVNIMPTTTVSNTTWTEYEIFLNQYVGDYRIAFVRNTTLGYYLNIDDILVDAIPSCMRPTAVTVTNINSYDATVSWTATDPSQTDWYLYYKPTSATAWDSVQVTGTTYTLISLIDNTPYEYYLRTICGTELSEATNVGSFRTACAPFVTLPYIENFDTYGTGSGIYPPCWNYLTTYSSAPYITTTNYSPPGSIYAYLGSGQYTILIAPLPDASINVNQLQVKFYLRGAASQNVQVGIIEDINNAATFVPVQTIPITASFAQYTAFLSNYTGTGNRIAFKFAPTAYVTHYLDNVEIDLAPTCLPVQNLTVSSVAGSSAYVTWTPNGTPDNFTVSISELGLESWTNFTTTASNYVLTGLNQQTTYTVKVYPTCQGFDGPADTMNFVTTCFVVADVIVGTPNATTSSSGAYLPTQTWYNYSYSQQIFDSLEIAGLDTIYGIGFQYFHTYNDVRNVVIYMGNTTQSTFSGISNYIPLDSMVIVYQGPLTLNNQGVENWVNINFTNPFDYNGLGNVVIAMNDITGSYGAPSGDKFRTHSVSGNKSLYFYQDSPGVINPASPSASSSGAVAYRNNTKFILPCQPASCIQPNVILADVTSDNADMIIVPGGSETSWEAEFKTAAQTTWTPLGTVSTTTFSLPGLTSNTTYLVRFRTVCSASDTSLWKMVTFTTDCGTIIQLPFTETFDTYGQGTNVIPTCWVRNSSYGANPYITTSYPISNPYSMYFYSSGTTYSMVVLPPLDPSIGIDSLQLSFWGRISTAGHNLMVGVMTNPNDASTFTLVGTVAPGVLNTYEELTVSFANYTDTGRYIAIRSDLMAQNLYSTMYIDNLSLGYIPNCVKPTDILFANIMQTTATGYWTPSASAVSYEVVYGLPGVDPLTATPIAENDTFFDMNGLTPNTLYHFYVRSVCAGGEYSDWTFVRTFRTACDAITTLPWTDNFDTYGTGTTIFPQCWTRNTTYADRPYITGTNFSAPGSMYFYAGTAGTYNIAATPMFDVTIPINTLKASFKYRNTYSTDTMYVGVMTDPLNASTFVQVAAVGASATAAWQDKEVFFNNYTGTGQYIAFKIQYNSTYMYGYIDNLEIMDIPTCPRPNLLTATNPTTTTVTLGWTEAGTASAWEVEYGIAGFTQGTGTVVPVTTNPYILSTLSPSTTYDFYVRAVCGVGDTSYWSVKATATTACLPFSLPITEGFESSTSIPGCWSTTTTAANYTVLATTGSNPTCTAHGGSNMLYYNSYSISSGNHAVLYSPLLNLTGAPVIVSYWQYRDPGYDTYLTEGVEVFYNTNASLTGATSLGFTSRYFATAGWYNITYTIPAGLIGDAYVMFKTNSLYGNNQFIDDISLTYAVVSCPIPTNLAISAINTDNATATWTAGGTETSWEVAYKASAASTWMTTIVNTTPTYLIPSLTAGTAYDVKVRAICGAGDSSAYTPIVNFTTTNISCSTPTNLVAGTITNNGATITWTAGGTETAWEVDYKLASATTWTTLPATTPTIALTGLSTCSDYNVRVRAVCGVGIYSSYTAEVNFSTLSPVPTNLQVTNITDQGALATWTAGGTETSWQIEYKLVSSANWASATVNGTPSYPLTNLQSSSLYEVRVKSLCSPNASAFTTPIQFTTLGMTFTINATAGANGTITPSGIVTVNQGANQTFTFAPNTGYVVDVVTVDGTPETGAPTSYTFNNILANHTIHVDFAVGIEENELAQLVELFPNPTTSIIELRLKSDNLHVKECKVFDMYGKLMRVIPIDAETTSIDVTDFASGVYFVRMDSERGTISKKFVKK